VGFPVVTTGPDGPGGPDGGPKPVTVLLFASAREAAGTGRTSVTAAGRTVSELLDHLRSTYGDGLTRVLPSCAVWVNRSPAAPTTVLSGGDEVALLPPVSGGCGTLDWQ
jgi:molybdopterin converting factor small subunit